MKTSIMLLVLLLMGFSEVKFSQQLGVAGSAKSYKLLSDKIDGLGLKIPTELYKRTISYPNAKWIRVKFGLVYLGRNSYIIIKSNNDGFQQKMNAETIEQWNFTSAYFNGNDLNVSLFVAPGDVGVHFNIDTLIIGGQQMEPENLCGEDNRVSSSNNAVGRIVKSDLSANGTGWILYDGRIVTAGHVVDGYLGLIIEFNVPNSSSSGNVNHPSPDFQYSINHNTVKYHKNGDGDDWAVMNVYPNSNTGLLPKEAQNAFFQVEQNNSAEIIRVTGYGADDGTANYTQQTDTGPNTGTSGDIIGYYLDTRGGNSGAPVINESNGKVIGIHTDGYCGSGQLGHNLGTSFINSSLWNEINPIFNLTVHQKNNSGGELTETYINRWAGSQLSGSFQSYSVNSNGALIDDVEYGDYETFRGKQDKTSSAPYEKFNNWSIDNIPLQDIRNHQKFLIDYPMTEITSQLNLTYSGVTIKNEFPEVPGLNPTNDVIELKDPWLIDYEDPEYNGTTYRNRGTLAPFKSRTSPFYPNYDTYYGSDQYIGVFLNQEYDPQGENAFYKVRSPIQQPQDIYLSQTGKNHNFYFGNWSSVGTDPIVQNNIVDGYYESPAIFRSGNASVTANLKGTQISNYSYSYSNNSQRKFVRTTQDGYLHNVYESMGYVWYERSTDNGTTWQLQNDAKPLSQNLSKSPSIEVISSSAIAIVWQEKQDVETYKIRLAYNAYPLWQLVFVDVHDEGNDLIPGPYSFDAMPIIAWKNLDILVVWRENSGGLAYRYGTGSSYSFPNWHTQGYYELVTGTDGSSTNPSMAVNKTAASTVFHLAWQQGINAIKYCTLTPDAQYNINISAVTTPSSGSIYNLNYKPSITELYQNGYYVPKLVWIGEKTTSPAAKRALFKDYYAGSWSPLFVFDYEVQSVNINNTADGNYVIGWSRPYTETRYFNKYVRNTSFSNIKYFNTDGKDIQINNGSNFNSLYASSLVLPIFHIISIFPVPLEFWGKKMHRIILLTEGKGYY